MQYNDVCSSGTWCVKLAMQDTCNYTTMNHTLWKIVVQLPTNGVLTDHQFTKMTDACGGQVMTQGIFREMFG